MQDTIQKINLLATRFVKIFIVKNQAFKIVGFAKLIKSIDAVESILRLKGFLILSKFKNHFFGNFANAGITSHLQTTPHLNKHRLRHDKMQLLFVNAGSNKECSKRSQLLCLVNETKDRFLRVIHSAVQQTADGTGKKSAVHIARLTVLIQEEPINIMTEDFNV